MVVSVSEYGAATAALLGVLRCKGIVLCPIDPEGELLLRVGAVHLRYWDDSNIVSLR